MRPKTPSELFRMFSTARRRVRGGDLLGGLRAAREALVFSKGVALLPAERGVLESSILALQEDLASSPQALKAFGPVSFRGADAEATAEFLGGLIGALAEEAPPGGIPALEPVPGGRAAPEEVLAAQGHARDPGAGAASPPPADGRPSGPPGNLAAQAVALARAGKTRAARAVIGGDEDLLCAVLRELNGAAIAARKAGRFPEAEADYRAALAVCPGDEGLLYNSARLFLETGRFREALDAAGRALQVNPGFTEALALRRVIERAGGGRLPEEGV